MSSSFQSGAVLQVPAGSSHLLTSLSCCAHHKILSRACINLALLGVFTESGTGWFMVWLQKFIICDVLKMCVWVKNLMGLLKKGSLKI